MFFLLFLLFYLAPETLTRAIPPISTLFSASLTDPATTLTYPSNDPSALLVAVSRDVVPSKCCLHLRTMPNIVRSCLVTIFACSWVSVHPDVPSPDEKWWRISLRRVEYLVWTLLTPELIVWWAARQWMGARKIQKEQKGRGWTITHGYFIQMGGFMLFKGKNRIGTLSYRGLCELLAEGRIQFPDITQEEIKDKNKSDGLSKTLVFTQVNWFGVQCVARMVVRLPLTDLELLTLALVVLNWLIYLFWWNKPFDVRCPVPVHLILPTEPKVSIPVPTSHNETMDHEPSTNTMPDSTSIDEALGPETCRREPTSESNQEMMSTAEDPLLRPGGSQRKNSQLKHMYTSVLKLSGWKKFISWPSTFISFVGKQLRQTVIPTDGTFLFEESHKHVDDSNDTAGLMRVPMFYSLDLGFTAKTSISVIPLIATLFNLVYCSGWSFNFATYAELWLWRISSLFVYIAPLSVPLLYGFGGSLCTLLELEWPWLVSTPLTWLATAVRLCSKVAITPFMVLYIVAKLILLAEAIYALRDLTPGSFYLVQSFLPHI